MMRITRPGLGLLLLPALLLVGGCGGGVRHHDGHHDGGTSWISNPGLDLVGFWTGTFTDQYGDYTASLQIEADNVVSADSAGTARVQWGAESVGLSIAQGDFVEIGPDHYRFSYQTVVPGSGSYVDSVTGELTFTKSDYLEGTFSTSSGTSGEVSFARNPIVTQLDMEGHFDLAFLDPSSRQPWYLGEVVLDANGNVVPGSSSYLTDDVSGPIDPNANIWPILGGSVLVMDTDTGYFEGTFTFASPDDTITLAGYLGTDLGVFAGVFEDSLGSGLVTFEPAK